MRQSPPIAAADLLALLGAGLAWGVTPAVTKMGGFTGIPVLAWSAFQALAAAVMLGGVVAVSGRRVRLDRHVLRHLLFYFMASGVIGLATPNVLLFLGMQSVPAGFFALLAPVSPILTTLALGLAGFERVDRRIIAGSVLAGLGTVLALLPGASLPDRGALPWAVALLLVPTCYAIANVIAAVWKPPGIDGMALAAGTLAGAAIALLPLAALSGHTNAPASVWLAAAPWMIGQGALQAIAFTCFFRMIVRQGGVFASQVAYLITLFGLFWGLLLFGDTHGWLTLPATLLIFGGLWLLTRRR